MKLSDFQWSDMIVKIVAAVVILVVTAFIAKIVKKVLTKQLAKIKVLDRHSGSGDTLAESLGAIASLIIWLLGLMAILNLFALTDVLQPLQNLLSSLLGALPNVIGAGLVLFIGFVLAKIVRELTVTALQAANVDRFADRLGHSAARELDGTNQRRGADGRPLASGQPGQPGHGQPVQGQPGQGQPGQGSHPVQGGQGGKAPLQISTMVGQIVYAVVLLVVAIAALQLLGIKAISEPATNMLQLILDAIPLIIGAGILLAIGVVIARFVGSILESLLNGLDIDNAFSKLGVDSTKTDVASIITRVVQIAIILFFAVAATNLLGFPQITSMLNTILAIGGRVVFGAVVIVAGVFIANLVASFVSGRTAQVVRVATIVLFVAIGLKYMGLADSVVNLAFGAVVVGGAAAAALAFGLGGREAAARQLNKMQNESANTDTSPRV
ncbi:mechanosensitive ion channel [Calidifontibacter sp. DB0510]|uniref:Mechanosensitive ion channel n=1 Tax=Metallococcus carri TaxID=1656884 RepID=A0A967B2D4_9MICO|nr:mechanosensitive ion channel [Metallococcus carri]NHN56737.1 mechanosensitive ion channel [Metallococcus carri]NOP37886.1 mechanosensitive ion channel [Calidifontibacter sp. DB2511S]